MFDDMRVLHHKLPNEEALETIKNLPGYLSHSVDQNRKASVRFSSVEEAEAARQQLNWPQRFARVEYSSNYVRSTLAEVDHFCYKAAGVVCVAYRSSSTVGLYSILLLSWGSCFL